jgi:hypothetical protein
MQFGQPATPPLRSNYLQVKNFINRLKDYVKRHKDRFGHRR